MVFDHQIRMFRKGLKIYFHGWVGGRVGGWVAGSIETKAISASKLKLKLKLTEAELGNFQNHESGISLLN